MMLRKLKTIKSGIHYRTPFIGRNMIDEEKRTVTLSFSSEAPVDRGFGREILDHSDKSIRMDRFKNGANLLMDHVPANVVGVIEDAANDTESRKASVAVRYSKSEEGEKVWQDVLDGIRRNVSVGYRIHKMVLEETKEGIDTYRVIDWEPFEVSMVGVPADFTVGVGRDLPEENEITIYERSEEDMKVKCKLCLTEHDSVDTRGFCTTCAEAVKREAALAAAVPPVVPAIVTTTVDHDTARKVAVEAEEKRTATLTKLGQEHDAAELASRCITDGSAVDVMMGKILEARGAAPVIGTPIIGMDHGQLKRFSVLKAIRAANPLYFEGLKEDYTFEREVSAEVAKKLGKAPQGIYLPLDVLQEQRDLNTTTDGQGGYTVPTDLLSMIEKLENNTKVVQLGATMLTGLSGNIAIPRQTGGATSYWLSSETASVTESTATFDQIAMVMNTIGAYMEYTRDFLIQSSIGAENFVRNDLALRIALGLDLAAINGSGLLGEPTGILNTVGIGDVDLGADGGPMTWAKFVQLWTEVAQDNAAMGATGFLTNSKVHGQLMTTEKSANTGMFIAPEVPDNAGMTNYAGGRAAVSNQVPSTLTKGESGAIRSAMIFGNWADVLIAMWGGLDILSNPFSKQQTRIIGVSAFQSADVKLRHVESFAASKDVDTSVG